MAIDPIGNVSLSLQIAILFLLILGLPLSRGPSGKKNFIRHGYSTIVALILHTILILLVMIPVFISGFSEFGTLTFLASITVWSHAVLGTVAEVLGIVIVVAWVRKGPSKMTCALWKRWMMPTFIIWVMAIINGALVHIFGLL
jgi:spore maturation protein SpmB